MYLTYIYLLYIIYICIVKNISINNLHYNTTILKHINEGNV